MYIQYSDSILNCLLDAVVRPYMSLKIYITILKRKTSLDVILKHKTPCSFSGRITARAEINSTPALPVIARAWLRHWLHRLIVNGASCHPCLRIYEDTIEYNTIWV